MKIYPVYYYSHNLIDIPPDLGHRVVKLKLADGKWIILHRVNHKKELQQQLIKFAPTDVYVSCSTFLNADRIQGKWAVKKDFLYVCNILLRSDFVLDFDDGEYSLDALVQAYNHLRKEFDKFKFDITKRGYHLWVLDFFEKRCTEKREHPFDRELYIEAQKILLANELINQDVIFDYKVAIDNWRVCRLWNSLYHDGFTICKAFNSMDDLIKYDTSRKPKG
jgi:hypothetical protein